MRGAIRKLQWIAGVIWALSWFELYLEIYRHHHVTATLLLDPASWFGGTGSQARPGGWLQTVLVCSSLAPPLFLALLSWNRAHHTGAGDLTDGARNAPFPLGLAAMAFGVMLCALATINQLIWRPPLDVDLTLRKGNGGFIVLGAVVALLGVMLARSKRGATRRRSE
jgi:hypothetical protein